MSFGEIETDHAGCMRPDTIDWFVANEHRTASSICVFVDFAPFRTCLKPIQIEKRLLTL